MAVSHIPQAVAADLAQDHLSRQHQPQSNPSPEVKYNLYSRFYCKDTNIRTLIEFTCNANKISFLNGRLAKFVKLSVISGHCVLCNKL